MNATSFNAEGGDIGGKFRETAGNLTGDHTLQAEGLTEQVGAKAKKGYEVAKDNLSPLVDQARQFVRDRPWASAALAGAVGIAVINTLRGK